MANGYGSSSTPSTSSTSSSSVQSRRNAQGKIAPAGFHYMPDGNLMSDAEHARLYGEKIITNFDLDLSDLQAASSTRTFTISGSSGAEFILEIKNEDDHYYNFYTNLFQAAKANLEKTIGDSSNYIGSIVFPTVTDNDHYDIYLTAKTGTKHADYVEARFADNTIDINNSIGSDSLILQKIIYQYTALTLTLTGFSSAGTVAGTFGTTTLSANRGRSVTKTAFSFTTTAEATAAYRILKQPTSDDILSFLEPVVAAAPEKLKEENIYPAVSNTDTVDGAVTSGIKVVMDTNVASKMAVGDRITGNTALNATIVTVAALNPDGDNVKEFSMSEAIALADGLTLSFSNQKNYQWPVNNINKIQPGMIVVPATNVTTSSSVGSYRKTITAFANTEQEKNFTVASAPALNTKFQTPTVVNGLVTVQPGNIVFDKQQVLALAGDTLKIGGYGLQQVLSVHGYDIKITDLELTLTAPTTTTTATSISSATVTVADREGVINNVSRVGGIGIDSSVQNPLITAGGGTDGAGTFTVDAVQNLESGTTLTIENTGRIATITGNIEIITAGTADATLRFDVDNLLSTSA